MKRILLKRLSMMNFKGIRRATIDFDYISTSIVGANGTGKTTVFDAFTWVMFGFDSLDRKQFDIKTLGADGEVTYHPFVAEVTATLVVDGEEITITRRYKENWVKTKGEATEHFAGHIEERLYNDVPCSVADFKQKIEDICPARTFKLMTSPYCFCQQKMQEQREMLITMAGGVSDADIASGNDNFQKLLSQLNGKTFDEFKREIGAKKKRIKAEIEEIPIRISQCNELMPAEYDYAAIEAEIREKERAIENIDTKLTDISEAFKAASSSRLGIQREITVLQQNIFKLEKDITTDVQSEYIRSITAKKELEIKQAGLKSDVANLEKSISTKQSQIEYNKKEIEKCSKYRDTLIAEWRKISAEQISFNDSDFSCPTCGRKYDINEVQAKQTDMIARFNAHRSERLAENKQKGIFNNNTRESIEDRNKQLTNEIESLQSRITGLKSSINAVESEIEKVTLAKTEKPDPTAAIEANASRKAMIAKIDELTKKLEVPASECNDEIEELKEMKSVITESLKTLREQIANRKIAENIKKQISELEITLHNLSENLAKLEQIEFTMLEFSKARINTIEDKINKMFSFVTFKMFDQQINGAVVEDCEATVNGIPFSSLNHAMQINAGLDIINTLIKHQSISAPIFIDNAESIINVTPTDTQIIKLIVNDQPFNVIDGELTEYEKAQI